MNSIAQSNKPRNESMYKISYPVQFLEEQSETMGLLLENYFQAYQLPKPLFQLITSYAYLQILIGFYNHPTDWMPVLEESESLKFYNQEIEAAIKDNAWLIEEIKKIKEAKLQSMNSEERKAVSNYDLYH